MACLFSMTGAGRGGQGGGGDKVVVKIELEARGTLEMERRNYEVCFISFSSFDYGRGNWERERKVRWGGIWGET